MNWLAQIAPTVASALGGPLAGIAVTALCKAMNLNEHEVNGIIQTGKLSADQIAQVKLAELDIQRQAQELGLDFAKLEVADSISARNMQMSTQSHIPSILAAIRSEEHTSELQSH